MINYRPSFARSAIAAAISSSFICTTGTAQEEYEVTSWDFKKQVFRAATKVGMRHTGGDNYAFTSGEGATLVGHQQAYASPFAQGVLKSLQLVVTTTNSHDGNQAENIKVVISKHDIPALVMESSPQKGQTTFQAHPDVVTRLGAQLIPRLKGGKVTTVGTGVVPPQISEQMMHVLDDMEALDKDQNLQDIANIVHEPSQEAPPVPGFMHKVPYGTDLPDTVTIVDVDSTVAAMTTAFANRYLPDQVADHSFRETKSTPVQVMLEQQPGYMIGALDPSKLGARRTGPVCKLEQKDNTSPVRVQLSTVPPVAGAHIQLFRRGYNSGAIEHNIPREDAKLIRNAIVDAQLDTLIKLSARWRTHHPLEPAEVLKLIHDQRLKMLCDYKLKDTKAKRGFPEHDTLKITLKEQVVIDSLVTRLSLPTHIRAQFSDHEVVGDFVWSEEFVAAVALLDDHEPNTTDAPNLTQYYYDVTDIETKVVARGQRMRTLRLELEKEFRGPLKAGPGDNVSQAVKNLAQAKDELETEIRRMLGVGPEAPVSQAVKNYQQTQQKLDADLRAELQIGPDDSLVDKVKEVVRKVGDLKATQPDLTREFASMLEQLEKVYRFLDKAEKNEDDLLPLTRDVTADKRLETLYNHYDVKSRQLKLLQQQRDAIEYIGTVDFKTKPWLDPELLVDQELLTADEFDQLKAVQLPKVPADSLIARLKAVDVVDLAFEGKDKTPFNFADDMDDLRMQFFTPPTVRGGKHVLKDETLDHFENYIKTIYGLDDKAPVVPVLQSLSHTDFASHISHVRKLRAIRPDLVQTLTKAQVMQSRFATLDYTELQLAHLHFQMEEERYQQAWMQYQLDIFHAWLREQPSVPTPTELDSFPETLELPNPARLTGLQGIVKITSDLTVPQIVEQVRAAGHIIHYLPPTPDDRDKLLRTLHQQLDQAKSNGIPDTPDNARSQFEAIARELNINPESWIHLYHGARRSPTQWVNIVKVIINHTPDVVMATHTDDKDIALARSGYDSETVSHVRKLMELDNPAYQAVVQVQEQRKQQFADEMQKLVTWAVKTKNGMYSAEELQSFPDDHDLTDTKWMDPLKEFYDHFKAKYLSGSRDQILDQAQCLADFTPPEYELLLPLLKDNESLINSRGINPDQMAKFNEAVVIQGLGEKLDTIIRYVNLKTRNPYLHAFVLKKDALALHKSGINSRRLTTGHLKIVVEGIDPKELLKQRSLSRQFPASYDQVSDPAKTYRWLMAHGDLLVSPGELMSVDDFQAMHDFVKAVILSTPGTDGPAAVADMATQKRRLQVAADVEVLLELYKDVIFTWLQTELKTPGLSATDLINPDGSVKDPTAFEQMAVRLGIKEADDQSRLAKYLALYPNPDFAPRIATHTSQFMKTGKKPSQMTDTQLVMAGDKAHFEDRKRMMALATAHKDEYTRAYLQTYQHRIGKKASHYEALRKGLTRAKDFVNKYALPVGADYDYDPHRYWVQMQLKRTLEQALEHLKNVDVPDAAAPPKSNQTPKHQELQDKQAELVTGATLGETKARLDEWMELDLVKTSEELLPVIQGVYEMHLPDDPVPPVADLPEDIPLYVEAMMDATSQHKTGPRKQELTDLENLTQEKNPKEFLKKFKNFEATHEMVRRKDITSKMDELIFLSGKGEDLTDSEVLQVKEIIKPWVDDDDSTDKADLYKYLSVKTNGGRSTRPPKVIEELNRIFTEYDCVQIKTLLKATLERPQIQAAYRFITEYEQLENEVLQLETGFTSSQKQQLEELRGTIKELKDRKDLSGADELGMEDIDALVVAVDDDTTYEDLLQVGRALKGIQLASDDTDDNSPIGKAFIGTRQVTEATAIVKAQKQFVESDDRGLQLGDNEPDYVHRHQRIIDDFDRDCKKCERDIFWTSEIRLQKEDMVDYNGYPDPSQLRRLHSRVDEELPKIIRRHQLFTEIQSQPESAANQIAELEHQLDTERVREGVRWRTVTLVNGGAKPIVDSGYIGAVVTYKHDAKVMAKLKTKALTGNSDVTDLPEEFAELGDAMAMLHTGRHPASGATIAENDRMFMVEQIYDGPVDETPLFTDVVAGGTKTVVFGDLRPTDATYLQTMVGVDIASNDALVLSDLVRLSRAGIKMEWVKDMDLSSPMTVSLIKSLKPQRAPDLVVAGVPPEPETLTDDDIVSIVGRLKKHADLIPPMIAKVPDVLADESASLLMKERGAHTATDALPRVIHQRLMLREELFKEFSHVVRDRMGRVDPAAADDVENAIRFYAEKGVDTAEVFADQARLDLRGLTKAKCIQAVRLYSQNAHFLEPTVSDQPGHIPFSTKVAVIFRNDITNAPLSAYQVLGSRLYLTIKSQVSRTARTFGNLMWLYAMNRVNLYLDDIAYNEGQGLISALTGTGEAADELLFLSGLTRREHLVEDIVRFFGGEAKRVYEENFKGTLGELDAVMENYVMPGASLAALAVQTPVSIYEVGTLMKLRPDGPDQVWTRSNVAYSLAYAMVRVIADIGRTQSQLNRQMIKAVDPAARRFTKFLDSKAPEYNDTVKPENRYYQALWESVFDGWNSANDYLGTSVGARAIRAPAELVEDLFFFRIYGSALSPVINLSAKQYELIYRSGWFLNDWARKDFAGLQYGTEGVAELIDRGMGLDSEKQGSWKYSVNHEMPRYSLSAANTYFAEGEAFERVTPLTNGAKGVVQSVADAVHYTGLDNAPGSVSSWAYTAGQNLACLSKKTKVLPLMSEYVVQPLWNHVLTPAAGWGWDATQWLWQQTKSAAVAIDESSVMQPVLDTLYGKKVTDTEAAFKDKKSAKGLRKDKTKEDKKPDTEEEKPIKGDLGDIEFDHEPGVIGFDEGEDESDEDDRHGRWKGGGNDDGRGRRRR